MSQFAALSQIARPAGPNVLLQQLSPPLVAQPVYNLILIDGVVGPSRQGNVTGAFIAFTWKYDNVFNQSVEARSAQTTTNALSTAPMLRSACLTGRRIGRVRFIFAQYSPNLVEVDTMVNVKISQMDEVYWRYPPYLEITFNFQSFMKSIRSKSDPL
jgi:hypothetical protein